MNTTVRPTLSALAPVALLAGLAAVAMGAKDGCIPVPPGQTEGECAVSADCDALPAPYRCIGYWTCDDALCNYHCGTPEPECTTAADCVGLPSDCPATWACVGGQCQADCGTEPAGCYGDQDCPSGTYCNAADVCLPPPGCKPGMGCPAVCYGQCVPNSGGCSSNADCGPGQVCQAVACPAMPCEPGAPCIECPPPTCVDAPSDECTSDADCGPGAYCAYEACTGGGACPPGAPCDPIPESCWGHCEVVPDPASCLSDKDCPPGSACQCGPMPGCPECDACFMQCVPTSDPGCLSDDDCGPGQTCVPTPCPMCIGADCPPCTGVCMELPEPEGCVVSGCSSQICASQPMDSDCMWDPAYECLKLTVCGNYAPDGGCAWAKTPAYQECMQKYWAP